MFDACLLNKTECVVELNEILLPVVENTMSPSLSPTLFEETCMHRILACCSVWKSDVVEITLVKLCVLCNDGTVSILSFCNVNYLMKDR